MKTCPNCGSKMGPDVNFCTTCGTDIRNVPLDSDKPAATRAVTTPQPVAPKQPVQPYQSTVASKPATEASVTPTQDIKDNAATLAQNGQQSAVMPQPNKSATQNPSATKLHAANMWQWFVDSWKAPFQTKEAEKWYGWVTILAENILLVLGLYICLNKYTQNQLGNSDMGQAAANIVGNFSTSLLFELFLYLILIAVSMIVIAYYAHKFVYGSTENMFDFINRIVSYSNLSAILYVVSFLCLIIGSEDMLKIGLPLAGIAMLIFGLGVYTAVIGDNAPTVQDKFYGLLIVVVLQVIVMFILSKVFGTAVYNQIQDLIHSSLNGMF